MAFFDHTNIKITLKEVKNKLSKSLRAKYAFSYIISIGLRGANQIKSKRMVQKMSSKNDRPRIYTASFTLGKKSIELAEETHKAVILALLNVLTSFAGNNDAVASRETVMDFISDVKPAEFKQYQIMVSDNYKVTSCTGETLLHLLDSWGLVDTKWLVDRGGKRVYEKETPASLGSLS